MATIPTEDPSQPLTPPTAPDPATDPNAWVRWWAWYKRASRPLQLGVGCASLLVVCSLCGGLVAAVSNAGNQGSPAPVTQATATQPPSAPQATTVPIVATSKPAATANPNAGVALYKQVFLAGAAPIQTDFTAESTDCNAQQIAACRADAVAVKADAASLEQSLNATPVPPCFAQVDHDLHAALTDFQQGSQLQIQGIDQLDGSQITAGSQLINAGNAALTQTSADISQASC